MSKQSKLFQTAVPADTYVPIVKNIQPVQTQAINSSAKTATFKLFREHFALCPSFRLKFNAAGACVSVGTNLAFHNNIQNIIESVTIRQGTTTVATLPDQGFLLHKDMLMNKNADWQAAYGYFYGIQAVATRRAQVASKDYSIPFLLPNQLYGSGVLPTWALQEIEIEVVFRDANQILEATVTPVTPSYALTNVLLEVLYISSPNADSSLRLMYPSNYKISYTKYNRLSENILAASTDTTLSVNKSSLKGVMITCRDSTSPTAMTTLNRYENLSATNLSTIQFKLNGDPFPSTAIDMTKPELPWRTSVDFHGDNRRDDRFSSSWFLPSTLLTANFLFSYPFSFDVLGGSGGLDTTNKTLKISYAWSSLPTTNEFIYWILTDEALYVNHDGQSEKIQAAA
jgi:hypothetical protein